MVARQVERVEWAQTCSAPSFHSARRPRGTKGLGVTYERKLAKALTKGGWAHTYGQWFAYGDGGARHLCQPDFILTDWELVVLECKLTRVEEALAQLEGLYVPVLTAVYKRPVHAIVVTRSLSRCPWDIQVEDNLAGAVRHAVLGRRVVLHWIGSGPI